ncbi:MAG: helix-turn-helix transcriptional regulator [Gammaproteobacteria bacterium]|nr:helix-turn-helix transcriptional regulator [Gammaproteobacteria bacterium]
MNFKSRSSLSFDQFNKIISCIYDAALDPEQWEDVIKKMAVAFKADQGYIRVINTQSSHVQHVYAHNKDPQWEQPYKDYYIHKDPWLNDILNGKENFISCTHHCLSNKEYEALEFHRDFVFPQNTHYGIGGKIRIENDLKCFLGLNRDKKRQGFEDEYLEALQLFVHHIKKSLLINEKTRYTNLKQNLLSDTLNQINSPLLLVTKSGEILFINSQAEQLLAQQKNTIGIKNNHLIISSPTDHEKLKQLIHRATDRHNSLKESGAMCFSGSIGQPTLSIIITPTSPHIVNIDDHSKNHALLALSAHQSQESPTVELLTSLYSLTPAEARLIVELCQGLTLDEISVKLGLSRNTLKSQLRTSFTKTGVSRQAELIRMINSGPAGIIKSTSGRISK